MIALPIFYRVPALRSWVMGHAVRWRVVTPLPWLFLQCFSFGVFGDGYLLCDKVTDAGDLHAHLCDRSVKEQFHRRKRESIEKLAHLIRKFHDAFLLHAT